MTDRQFYILVSVLGVFAFIAVFVSIIAAVQEACS